MSPFLEEQIDALITDSRWDIAYLGMQIVIESLALAAFGAMTRATEEPLLKKLLRYVMADEARHVAFGVLSLAEYYGELSDAELKDRQEFLAENTLRSRDRSTTPEIWERMGVKLEDVLPSLLEAMQKMGTTQFAGFQRGSSPSSCRTSASSDSSTPTTAISARSGARPACWSSSSLTTPDPTTRPTTRSRRTERLLQPRTDAGSSASLPVGVTRKDLP